VLARTGRYAPPRSSATVKDMDITHHELTPDRVEAHLGQGRCAGLLFTSTWCAAGALLARDLAPSTNGPVPLVVVDIDSFPHLADRFQVKSLPTLIVMHGEREQGRLLGAFSSSQVTTLLTRPTENSRKVGS
jgi:thioredoxin-like negative regulator of GroEL